MHGRLNSKLFTARDLMYILWISKTNIFEKDI